MKLSDFFSQNQTLAVAVSGGVDSSFLICAAKKAGVSVKGYYVKSLFQPEFETRDVLRLAREFSLNIEIIDADVLCDKTIYENPPDRCYYCKKLIFSKIIDKAKNDGFSLVCDGTNASDDISDRPGIKALEEFGVVSPLKICGIAKEKIREYSRELGLFTAEKYAYACLATRVVTGQKIDADILKKIEICETKLFSLGFTDLRVRVTGDCARLQINDNDFSLLTSRHETVSQILNETFSDAVLDLKTIR